MKKQLVLFISGLAIISWATACNNDTNNAATSTPIDSTNINGTAPVEYGVRSDSDSMLPSESDGLKANTDSQEIRPQP